MYFYFEKISGNENRPEHCRCPRCDGQPRLVEKMLDIRSGKIVRLFQCPCGERIWDD
jgi:hypothetical protein